LLLFFNLKNFCQDCVWTQGLLLTKQAIYHLIHTVNSFCFSLFFRQILVLLLGLASGHDLLTSASQIGGIIDMNHHDGLVMWDSISLSGLVSIWDLLNCTAQVPRITGIYHHALPSTSILLNMSLMPLACSSSHSSLSMICRFEFLVCLEASYVLFILSYFFYPYLNVLVLLLFPS
jgi:hypothetical protein